MIITGAPVENMPFEEVDYWAELCEVMDWSLSHVYSTMHICWGAQAGLYHHFGIPKYRLPQKLSGIFRHTLLAPRIRLCAALTTSSSRRTSRNTEVRLEDIKRHGELEILFRLRGSGRAPDCAARTAAVLCDRPSGV